MIKYDANLHY